MRAWTPRRGETRAERSAAASSRVVGTWSRKSVSTSNVEGSAQCRSSQAQYTAACSASSTSHATKASWVFCFCFCGLSVSGGVVRRDGATRARRPTAERIGLGEVDSERSVCWSLAQLGLGAIVPLQLQEPLQVLDDRIEGTVLVIGRAAKLDAGSPSCAMLLFERLHQAGFANARLTAQQHHLASPVLGLLPALLQQPSSSSRPTKGVKPVADRHLKAALGRTLSHDSIHWQGVEIPLSVWGPRSWHSKKPCTSRWWPH